MNRRGKWPTTRCTPLRGASLPEIAISLSAVAMGALLVLPALSEARRDAKAVKCLFNLKQLGEAASSHAAADPSEFAIPAHPEMGRLSGALGTWEWGGKSGSGEPQQGRDPISSKWGTMIGRGPATRGLNRFIYGDVFPDHQRDPGPSRSNWRHDMELELDAFRCPADVGYTGHHYLAWSASSLTSYDHYGNSYAANSLWVGARGPSCRLMSNSPYLRPTSDVPNPRNTILMMENCGLLAYRKNFGADDCPSLSDDLGINPNIRVFGWHGSAWVFTAAYVDGHASTIRMEGHEQPQARLARYPGSDDPVDPCYENYHCVTIRGPGWQLDTLPAPLVPTPIRCGNSGAVILPYGP